MFRRAPAVVNALDCSCTVYGTYHMVAGPKEPWIVALEPFPPLPFPFVPLTGLYFRSNSTPPNSAFVPEVLYWNVPYELPFVLYGMHTFYRTNVQHSSYSRPRMHMLYVPTPGNATGARYQPGNHLAGDMGTRGGKRQKGTSRPASPSQPYLPRYLPGLCQYESTLPLNDT